MPRPCFGTTTGGPAAPKTAADLTAETFAAAYVSRKRFRDVGAPAQAWLFTIARRQLSHFVRHEKVRDKYRHKLGVGPVELSADDFERIDELVDLEATRDELRRVMGELPEQQAHAPLARRLRHPGPVLSPGF
jgi:RNA polymerase sigma-70 factor (ECF subfamily)